MWQYKGTLSIRHAVDWILGHGCSVTMPTLRRLHTYIESNSTTISSRQNCRAGGPDQRCQGNRDQRDKSSDGKTIV